MSSILSKETLNDFITPNQVCINPIKNTYEKKADDEVIEVGKEDDVPTKVNITLQDCLACSGCVTTSEELVLEQHSYEKFFNNYKDTLSANDDLSLVISISPTCRISLLNYLKFDNLNAVDEWLLQSFKTLFKKKYESNQLFITSTQVGKELSNIELNKQMMTSSCQKKSEVGPRFTVVCPGVVLYIEKQHNSLTSNFIKIKPEMSMLGNLLKKNIFINKNIYHLSIMPCFDKKLESSKNGDDEVDVDCVLTPKEIINMFIDNSIDLKEPLDHLDEGDKMNLMNVYRNEDLANLAWMIDDVEIEAKNTSGGYAYRYIKEYKMHLQREHPSMRLEIQVENGKNNDMKFYKLLDLKRDGGMVASSCELYGFKNLQNLIRKLDKGNGMKQRTNLLMNHRKKRMVERREGLEPKDCDFIELMACPGGCMNGGGLLLPDEETSSNSKKRAESLIKLNEIYLREFSQKSISDLNEIGIGKQPSEYIKHTLNTLQSKEMNFLYKVERREQEEKSIDSSTAIFESW
ncbi:hypothetical protein ACO0R3_001852 [Hanseniaspora guilliermondii]